MAALFVADMPSRLAPNDKASGRYAHDRFARRRAVEGRQSPAFRPLFIFRVNVNKPGVIGQTPSIGRRVGEITGGVFEGERLRGKILSGGSDWQTGLCRLRPATAGSPSGKATKN